MLSHDSLTLVHAVGFVTGIALYAMLAVMVVRTAGAEDRAGGAGRPRDRIPLATAALGLVWNAGGLLVYGTPTATDAWRSSAALHGVAAAAFSALGFLPAVVVHAALESDRGAARAALTGAAYALSTAAALMHVTGAGGAPSRPALQLLAVGYAVLLAALALRLRGHAGARVPLAAAALASFAAMAVHLGHHGAARESVVAELVGHHASLALALVILYEDFRFALADLFLKRVLSAVALVGLALTAYLAVAPSVSRRLAADPADPRAVATLLALWVLTAVLYPALRKGVAAFVDRVVLRRADYTELRGALAARLAGLHTVDAVLDALRDAVAPAVSAGRVTWDAADPAGLPPAPVWTDRRHQAVVVPVHTTEAPAFALTVGGLRAGRRLLSDDLAFLDAAGVLAARRADAVRVAQERWDRVERERETLRLATEAELRALRAQLNPHFLFNALTTVGHLMREAPDRALDTLLRLTALLRAVLKPTAGGLVRLGDEMEIVEAYLAIERARFEERLRVTVDVPEALRELAVPPLLLQPLVENAVKHGISPLRAGGEVTVRARVEPAGEGAPAARLHLTVTDSGAGVAPAVLARRRESGVGLASVERRVDRQFGAAGAFAFTSAPGAGTSVDVWLPVLEPRGELRAARSVPAPAATP